ncbi:hypothetical protein PTSG_11267 [Salpingoeca rosetta]|uniref:Ribosomal protein S36 n=1 Tax=Salpingoeca rosetta (strain ATCC 50818 / BSB-021) TaxID=946362 RepID=F2USX1_SALR5|nr:uncharacterized protein PTSG_11267 [Salpingoeca rosetta]EGD81230.1 hypothetical protein PTSG_11267 [Salpingoeca rosetta]|eukprot:XP_004987764.1 hypothetical protein PTSG_11267 [Salpingoeca rosetta]
MKLTAVLRRMISFPARRDASGAPLVKLSREFFDKMASNTPSTSSAVSSTASSSSSSSSKYTGPVLDTTPAHLRYRQLSAEEMETIELGGAAP